MRHGALLIAAVLVISSAACSHSSSGAPKAVTQPSPTLTWSEAEAVLKQTPPASWRVSSDGPITFRVPQGWHITPFLGQLPSVVYPLSHVSTFALPGPCGSLVRATQRSADCFDHRWSVPADGVLLGWTENEIPSKTEYKVQPGRPASIGRYRGKLQLAATAQGTQIEAAVPFPGGYSEFIQITDEIGPEASQQAVTNSLHVIDSIRFKARMHISH